MCYYYVVINSAVVEDRFLCRHDGDNCRQKQWPGNKCSDVSTKIQLRVTWWIIGTGQVNSGGLSVKHATALAWQRAFRTQSSLFEGLFYLYFVFLNVSFHFQNSTLLCRKKKNLCRHVIFSQKCCFVANFVDDSTSYFNLKCTSLQNMSNFHWTKSMNTQWSDIQCPFDFYINIRN